nr:MAG TPA: hypothetical protein [Caudoviricetes sp.]
MYFLAISMLLLLNNFNVHNYTSFLIFRHKKSTYLGALNMFICYNISRCPSYTGNS